MVANRSRNSFSAGSVGANRKAKSRISKNCGEVSAGRGVSGGTKSIGGRGRRRRLIQERRQRRHLVAGLDLLDLVDVRRAEQLGAVQHQRKVGVGSDDLVDALGFVALPVRPGQKVFPAAVTGGAAAHVGEVVGVEVDELQRVVAVLFDRRNGQHQRFGAQVGADRRVRRVRVRRLDRLVFGRVNPVRCCGFRSSRPCTRGRLCRRSRSTCTR